MRELQNRIRRAVILAEGKRLTVDDLELESPAESLPPATLKEAREAVEREMVNRRLENILARSALRRTNWASAARRSTN